LETSDTPPAVLAHEQWTTIAPHRGWFDWRLRLLWRYRDLIVLFVWRDFVATYKQTILGPAWHLLRPLLTTLVFTVVFGRIARLPTDGAPAFLFYMTGQVTWAYFSGTLDAVAKTFVSNAPLMGKVYFHRLAIPVSLVLSNLVTFAIQFGLLLVLVILHGTTGGGVPLASDVVLLPGLVALLAGYALACGILICALTVRYRDLHHVITLSLQLLMYVTPVLYPASAVPRQYAWLATLNPLSSVLEAVRRVLLGTGSVDGSALSISGGLMLLLLVFALACFSRVERSFMDTV
jgi:lipopolysaccharide transport system permease protein